MCVCVCVYGHSHSLKRFSLTHGLLSFFYSLFFSFSSIICQSSKRYQLLAMAIALASVDFVGGGGGCWLCY